MAIRTPDARIALVLLGALVLCGLAALGVKLASDPIRLAVAGEESGLAAVAREPDAEVSAIDEEAAPTAERAPERAARAALGAPVASRAVAWSGVVRERSTRAPVEGALVRLTAGDDVVAASTDGAGRFALEWGGDAAPALEVLHARYADLRRAHAELSPDAELWLERSAGLDGSVSLRGSGTFDGGRATLWTSDARTREPTAECSLSPAGTFAFDDLEPGEYEVAVALPAGPLAYSGGILLGPGERRSVALEVRLGAALHGRVVTAAGEPVAGARVEARPRVQGLSRRVEAMAELETVSASDGGYELVGLAPGSNEVTARGPAGTWERVEVEMPSGGEALERDLVLPGLGGIVGRVLDAGGRPVAGARVVAGSERDVERAITAWTDRPEAEPGDAVRCNAIGRFEIAGLPGDRRLAVAALPPAGDDAHVPVLASARIAAGAMRELELVLAVGVVLRGLVVSVEGEPVAGVRARAEVERGRSDVDWSRAETDAAGRFALGPLPPGSAELSLDAPGWRSLRRDVELVPGGDELVLELEPAWEVAGIVRDPDGFAVASARVDVLERSDDEDGRRRRRGRRGDTTDAFGRFHVDGLSAGSFTVRARARGWDADERASVDVEVPVEAWAELVLVPAERVERARVEGEVVLVQGGPPVGLRLGDTRGGVVEVDGSRFTVGGLWPGTLTLRITADGCVECVLDPVELLPGARVDLGRIELAPATFVLVRVEDGEGRPVRDARVRIVPAGPAAAGGAARPVDLRERRAGRYESARVPRGPADVRVEAEGFRRGRRSVTVGQGPRQTVRVVLERG